MFLLLYSYIENHRTWPLSGLEDTGFRGKWVRNIEPPPKK
jgi:hypothetical protein